MSFLEAATHQLMWSKQFIPDKWEKIKFLLILQPLFLPTGEDRVI